MSRPSAALDLLPSLIKYRICAYLGAEDLDGLLCVILSVPHLAVAGQDALSRRLSWAGKRFICIGDYAYELPPKLTAADKERWCRPDEDYATDDEDNLVLDSSQFAYPHELAKASTYRRAMRYLKAKQAGPDGGVGLPTIEQLVKPTLPQLKDPVLRNLTLKQYYRGQGVGGNECIVPLGVVAIIQASWTSDVSAHRIMLSRDDAHGHWAGGRMDIASAEMLSDDWVDVTDTIVEEL
ncbi:hypothetical protein H4R19_007095, partial [Coemansia spiralis]